ANLDRLKSEFVAMVSHDLRSPLTAIQLSQDFLRTEELSKDGRDALQESSDTIKRLLSLVNNLLDLDRLEAQNIQINPEERSLRDVCMAATSATKLLAEQAGIAVEVDAEPELKAYYDFERIMQVFFNLLSNAFKFSPSGTKVSIKCFASDNQAIVEVKDEGKGIPVDQLEHVFERFKQVDPSTDNKVQKGSGLGLAICKAIVERHGGKISAISDAGNGTTIRFSLPLTGLQS
ncbi:MAG TPA: HAMP domain-containing sensor histidine kinase, partial [Candidatus Melainabacteria bacterium]|nr:HAMP domain-containing sensor histidine kinase [Candidatus Melainabacteria bacterium]